ncbi:uncharacterized protein LOC132904445 [Amyelois transitella]|uniref:uncharacterized protein LOC132904445 n=1 Tax=Amyelois transitella TaxID=680683 RepID=UPI00299010B8|nr:uncharacterized protein LOC132904445 [Amyelois transitella]
MIRTPRSVTFKKTYNDNNSSPTELPSDSSPIDSPVEIPPEERCTTPNTRYIENNRHRYIQYLPRTPYLKEDQRMKILTDDDRDELCSRIRNLLHLISEEVEQALRLKRTTKDSIKEKIQEVDGLACDLAIYQETKNLTPGQRPCARTQTSPILQEETRKMEDFLKPLMERLEENSREIREMKNLMDHRSQENIPVKNPHTYAQIAASSQEKPITLHSVIVDDKTGMETGDVVMERIREVAGEGGDWVKIERILEKMLVARIRWHVLPGMSRRQYGFMPQRCTEDSLYVLVDHIRQRIKDKKLVLMVSLDIEGAFDNAWWPAIKCRLAETQCPPNLRRMVDSYLGNRRVRVRYAGAESVSETSKGCVQGSIGGPTFWNLLLDPLLVGLDGRGDYCQAFADDVVLVFSGDTAQEVQGRANGALEYVRRWGVENKLRFAPLKTKAMVLTNKLKYDTPILSMGGVSIEMSQEIKILGLTLDSKLTFNAHVANICRKALNLYKQLSRAARIGWGLNSEVVRTIYVAVVEPVIMYASSVWAAATHKLGVQKQLNVVQRGFAQKIVRAYRTVSLNAALLLAGLLPLDMRIREAALLYEVKKGISRRVVGDREIERPVDFLEAPHPAGRLGLKFSCLEDRAQVDEQQHAQLHIYTDGSKHDGKVGAALTVWEGAAETSTKKLKLDNMCTVYQAELLALSVATERALRSSALSCNIYCDSRSALETVSDSSSLHNLALTARANIKEVMMLGKIINLFWIKAHAGLEGNERADDLAKSAALGRVRPHYDRCPVSFVKRQIRMDTIDEWNRRYVEGDTASTTKLFFPDAGEAYQILRKIALTPVLVQVFTGHGGFSQYLNRFKCKESPTCACDPANEESIDHVLTECAVYDKDRNDLEIEIGEKSASSRRGVQTCSDALRK